MLVSIDSDVYVLPRPYVAWQVPERGFKGLSTQAITIAPDGMIVLVDRSGYLNILMPPYDQTNELLVPLPELNRPDVVAIGADRSILLVGTEGTSYLAQFPDLEWKQLPSFDSSLLTSQRLATAIIDDRVVTVDVFGAVFILPSASGEWIRTISPSSPIFPADAVTITPEGTIVRASRNGTISISRPSYDKWDTRLHAPISYPRFIAVGPTESIAIVDRDGRMYQSIEPYLEWNGPFALPISSLEAIAIGTDDTVVIVDHDGNVYESPSPYRKWNLVLGPVTPSILSWIALGAAILGIVSSVPLARRSFSRAIAASDQNLIHIESDRPVENPDRVAASMMSVADRIVRTIRHRNASAPIVFAITGNWGSGKSSLMNLVKIKLEEDDCPCISFNAWHHQNETHLFASLMESIRRDAVRNRSFGGFLGFYLNLLVQRSIDNPLRLVLFGIIALTVAVITVLEFSQFNADNTGDYLKLAALLAAQLWTWSTRWNPLKAFGVSPASLVRASRAWIQFPRFSDRLSFRHQFGRSFRQVCKAFGNRHLVIIIDDLDRCRSEQVVEILEAVNFLTSNGECFVLIGIDEVRVKHAVGLYLQRVAEEMAMTDQEYPREDVHYQGTDGMSDLRRYRIRQDYAEHYLEKLINLRIPVPRPDWEELTDVF